jgi:hypothetical protein
MFSVKDLVVKYDAYADEQVFDVYASIDTYSNEAKEALNIVIAKRGGLEKLIEREKERNARSKEIERIKLEVTRLSTSDTDDSFLKKIVTSNILSNEEVNEIVDNTLKVASQEKEDKEIKPRTVWGSIIGGGIASLVGGSLWGLQLIYSKKVFIILLIGLVLLCYGIIKFSTRQSNKNVVVLITTIVSVLMAIIIGQFIYEIVGYQK